MQKLKMYLAHNNYKKLNPNNWQMWKLILLRRCKQIRFLNFSVIHYYFLWLTHKSLLYSFVQLVTAPVTVCTLSVLLCSIVIKIIFRYLTFSSGNIRIMWFFIHFINAQKNRLPEGVPSVQRWFSFQLLVLPFNFRRCDILAKPLLANLLEDALLIEFLEGLV